MRYVVALFIFVMALANANASCSISKTSVVTVSFPSVITVQRDTPVGTVIATAATTNNATAFCNTSYTTTISAGIFKDLYSRSPGVYYTNISGVGIKIGNAGNVLPMTINSAASNNIFTGYNLSLVKIGPITSGMLSSGIVYNVYLNTSQFYASQSITASQIVEAACTIQTPNLTFPIGNVLASSFGTSVGTTPTSAQSTQNLGLDCISGANINVSFSGTQNPDVGTTSVLALTGQGNSDVAKGVGVQILYNGSPLVLNNRIVLKKSSGSQETFPLTARYYQTKTAVTTGTANASATLNLTYQ